MNDVRNTPRPGDAGEVYPTYDALWHLVAIGLLDRDHNPLAWPQAAPAKPTRVAVIDTSVAVDHPNLVGAIDKARAIDFASTRLGALPYGGNTVAAGVIAAAGAYPGLPHTAALAQELAARLAPGSPAKLRIEPATSPLFSSHGTAICGLVGARPVEVTRERPPVQGGAAGGNEPLVLPYVGADPWSSLVPISTSFDPDPEQMILAFLYAELIGADIILLPRDVPDPIRTVPALDPELQAGIYPCELPDTERELWTELRDLMVAISRRIPIVCAAGNSSEDGGIYPSALAAADNGIIAVGAMNAKGFASGFSALGTLTVSAPSSDSERCDRAIVRLDRQDADYRAADAPDDVADPVTFSPMEIISTDVPGRGGYAGSRFRSPTAADGSIREFGSWFCTFGGTSAASAIAAGFLSTGITSGALAMPADPASRGVAAKNWLVSKAVAARPNGDGVANLICWSGAPDLP